MWKERIKKLIEADYKGGKTKFLKSVYRQIEQYGEQYLPTAQQIRIIAPMWVSHEKLLRHKEDTFREYVRAKYPALNIREPVFLSLAGCTPR